MGIFDVREVGRGFNISGGFRGLGFRGRERLDTWTIAVLLRETAGGTEVLKKNAIPASL